MIVRLSCRRWLTGLIDELAGDRTLWICRAMLSDSLVLRFDEFLDASSPAEKARCSLLDGDSRRRPVHCTDLATHDRMVTRYKARMTVASTGAWPTDFAPHCGIGADGFRGFPQKLWITL